MSNFTNKKAPQKHPVVGVATVFADRWSKLAPATPPHVDWISFTGEATDTSANQFLHCV